jgi:hypothetical protein
MMQAALFVNIKYSYYFLRESIMAVVELLGTSQAFRSDLFNLNYSEKLATLSDKSNSSTTPGDKIKQIDFENVLKSAMSPPKSFAQAEFGSEKPVSVMAKEEKNRDSGEQIFIQSEETVRLESATQPLHRHISPQLARSSYNAVNRSVSS